MLKKKKKALTALLEGPGVVAGIHVIPHNCNSSLKGSSAASWPLRALHTNDAETYMQARHSYTQNNKIIKTTAL